MSMDQTSHEIERRKIWRQAFVAVVATEDSALSAWLAFEHAKATATRALTEFDRLFSE